MKSKTSTEYRLASVAKFDPVHVTVPQLFVSLNRKSKQREDEKLVVIYTPSRVAGTGTFEFHGPDRLGVDDLRVLQGLIAVASEQSQGAVTSRGQASHLDSTLVPTAALENITVSCSFTHLARTVGYRTPNSGETLRLLRESIERMSKVTIFYRESLAGRAVRLDSFISQYESDLSSDGLRVGLNSRLTKAVLAVNKGEQYLKIHLGEVRQLRSDPARLMHHRLHFLKEGGSVLIAYETLAGYIWPPAESKNAFQKRLVTVKRALLELQSIGWTCLKVSDGIVRIVRPRVSVRA